MKRIVLLSRLFSIVLFQLVRAQCTYKTPPPISKFDYASREITFTQCKINGKVATVAHVQKGESISMEVTVNSVQKADYCPGCIVQIYWGINNYTSTCAVSFYGYKSPNSQSHQRFKAPDKDGVYYITMGGSLEYGCSNNLQRPVCDPAYSFAVLIVGNPDPEKKMTLQGVDNKFLETTVIKSGCFGQLTELKWYLNGVRLETKVNSRIEATIPGTYRAVWKNCVGDSVYLDKNIGASKELPDTSSLHYQINHSNKFTLNNLQFATQSAVLSEDSKVELNKLAKILKDQPSIIIRLEGHTDVIGTPKANQKLSEERVKSAKNYLVRNGVQSKRIQVKGYGGTKPVSKGDSEDEHRKNRRVEIVILAR